MPPRMLPMTLLLISSATAPLPAAATTPSAAPIVAAEQAFAADAAAHGIRQAFLKFLGADSWVFAPTPTPGLPAYQRQPESTARLDWLPDTAAIAASGDFGFDLGPYRWAGAKGAPAFGHFLSVWQRDAQGHWHNVVDHGISHAAVPLNTATVVDLTAGPAAATAVDMNTLAGRTKALASADSGLREALRAGRSAAARLFYLDSDLRVLRDGHLPAVGTEAAALLRADKAPFGSASRTAMGIAASADLAYTIGGDASQPAAGADTRIWRYQQGQWRVLADEVTAIE